MEILGRNYDSRYCLGQLVCLFLRPASKSIILYKLGQKELGLKAPFIKFCFSLFRKALQFAVMIMTWHTARLNCHEKKLTIVISRLMYTYAQIHMILNPNLISTVIVYLSGEYK